MDRGEIIIYQTADGETRLDVRMENDSVWLTQAQIAQLFGTEIPAISKHIRNIYISYCILWWYQNREKEIFEEPTSALGGKIQ